MRGGNVSAVVAAEETLVTTSAGAASRHFDQMTFEFATCSRDKARASSTSRAPP